MLAARNIVQGAINVSKFMDGVWRKAWHSWSASGTEVNGGPGFVLRDGGEASAVLTVVVGRDNLISRVFVVRNPDKLGGALGAN